MAPVGGNDEQHSGRSESRARDDHSNPMEARTKSFRRDKPHPGNKHKQESDFGEFGSGCVSDCQHRFQA